MACTKPYVPSSTIPSFAVTTDTKIWRTVSTTTLNIMGESGSPFKGQCSVTQGDLLSPMIFNVVGDTVLPILVSVV